MPDLLQRTARLNIIIYRIYSWVFLGHLLQINIEINPTIVLEEVTEKQNKIGGFKMVKYLFKPGFYVLFFVTYLWRLCSG